MLKVLNFLIIFFSFGFCLAQSFEKSSLSTSYDFKLIDTAKVNQYNSLANKYLNSFPDSTFYYSNKALTESIKLKYLLGIAEANIILAKFYHINLNNFNKSLFYFKNSLKLIYYLDTNSSLIDSTFFKAKLAEALNGIGLCEQKLGKNADALKHINKALIIGKSISNDHIISKSLHNMALIYSTLGDINQALDYSFRAIEKRNKLLYHYSNASTYNLIGNIYYKINDNKNALKYTLLTHKLLQNDSLGNKQLLVANTINLAIIYAVYNNKTTAESYFNKANELIFKYKIFSALPGYFTQRAAFYEEEGNLTKATEYNILALNVAGGNKREASNAHFYLGSIYFKKGKYNKALKHALNSLNISREINSDIGRIIKQQKLVIKIYEKLKNNQEALVYSKDLIGRLDSLAASNTELNIIKKKELFDFEKSIFLEKEKEKMMQIELNQKIKRQEIIRNYIIVLAIFIIIILVLVAMTYKNRIKSKQQLMLTIEENHQNYTKNLIREQELLTLQRIINGQDLERKRIAEELHDSVGSALAGIKLNLATIFENHSKMDNHLEKIISKVDLAYNEVRTISHNLIPPVLDNNSFTNVIDSLINDYRNVSKVTIFLDYLDTEKLNTINNDLKVAVYRILQELLQNAVNHSDCNQIEIAINNYEEEMTVVFEDNGTGFDMNEKKFGMGLRNIQSRVNTLNGNLTIDSKLGRGSAFYISIKIQQKNIV
ncbi:MAG: tetratricopeptide repeat protein [Bacteroidota bacterium]|nr:tetratricopeptide repeat protein [Bacteroidota bacterium]MCA6442096.1 tetratricopeptide repeat protein [Bacteroidota bacterium]